MRLISELIIKELKEINSDFPIFGLLGSNCSVLGFMCYYEGKKIT